MLLQITHETTYRYQPPVETARHVAHLTPLNGPCQHTLGHRLQLDPEPVPADFRQHQDALGNTVTHWALTQSHQTLRVVAVSQVRTRSLPPAASVMPWEAARAHYRYHSAQPQDPESAFVFASHHVPRHADFVQFAATWFEPDRPLVSAALALMQGMHQQLRYESHSTDIHTPALEALHARRGVCQDFSHILLACLRSLGLSARYVSGYLRTQPAPGQVALVGSDASHAWVALHVPDARGHESGGWLHLDPTNGLADWGNPSPSHVQLATGRDFSDVSPLRGVLHGGASHTLQVGVTVEALPDPGES